MVKLSIMVPLYNQSDLVVRALDSIRGGKDIEIIVVDDASTDNSLAVVVDYMEHHRDKNIILLKNEKNIGVGLTINRALDVAQGEYVCILCSDDYYIEPIDAILGQIDGTDMIYYDLRINDGTVWPLSEKNHNTLVGATKIMRRAFVGNTRRTSKRIAGDKDFYMELLKKNPTRKYTGIVLYHYDYPREGSLINIEEKRLRVRK